MRIALVADIHGNLLALDAVLADLAGQGVDQIVNLGDTVSGPLQPAETAERLMHLGLATVRGNHESNLLTQRPEAMGPSDRFAADCLMPHHRAWLATLPSLLSLLDGELLLCHGTPVSDTEYFLETVDEAGVRPASLDEVSERVGVVTSSLIVCGHSHIPRAVRLSNGQMVVNPGSVGVQAFSAETPFPHVIAAGSPHARYAVVERTTGGWETEFRKVDYDWQTAARLAEEHGRGEWGTALRSGRLQA